MGPNQPCICGSGKKYKKCCGYTHAEPPRRIAPTAAELSVPQTQIKNGRLAEAEQEARRLTEWYPDFGYLWKILAQALWMQGKDALESLQRAATLLPQDAEAHTNLGNALRARGDAAAALDSHRQALAINPNYAQAHNNLGSALTDLGRHTAAVESFQRAAAIQPDFVLAHVNLGNVLRTLGRPGDAAESYTRALTLRPDLVDVWNSLGSALRDTGWLEEAAASHRRALAIDSNNVDTCMRLGAALCDLGRYGDAEACYRQALNLKPDGAAAYSDLAAVLTFQNRAADAEHNCRRALELDPHQSSALLLLADLEAAKGQFPQADALLARVLEIAPDMPEAWAAMGRWRRAPGADDTWLREATRVVNLPLPARRETTLRYVLGKHCDDSGHFEEAFAHYRRANDLARLSTQPYDRQQSAEYVDLVISRYDQHWLREARRAATSMAKPVFIVGMWRSGTTLAEQILASHPAVFGAGEVPYWQDAAARYEQAGLADAACESMAALAEQYFALVKRTAPRMPCVVDKMASNFMHLGLICAALPQARIIHMQRHPIDTCLSIYFQDLPQAHRFANDLEDLAHYYRQYSRIMAHWRGTLPPDAMLEVPYEALVDDQEQWSRRMIEFIGLEWDPRCLEFYRTDRTVLTRSKWQVRQPLNRASVGRWRNYQNFIRPLMSLSAAASNS